MAKRFNSVSEMISEVAESASRKKELSGSIAQSQISKILFICRTKSGLSQEELGKKIGWSQGKVSKIEHQLDNDFSMGELSQYCSAIGLRLEVSFVNKGSKWFDLVKFHYFKMKTYLDKIAGSAKGDAKIQTGVNGVMGEATVNLMNLAESCIKGIKTVKDDNSMLITEPAFEMGISALEETNIEVSEVTQR